MIFTIAIYVLSSLLGFINLLFPDFQIWPDVVFEVINTFITGLLELNTFFLIIPLLLTALVFLLRFFSYFFLYKITTKILNYFRGSGEIN
jgi:hypothetical protein